MESVVSNHDKEHRQYENDKEMEKQTKKVSQSLFVARVRCQDATRESRKFPVTYDLDANPFHLFLYP